MSLHSCVHTYIRFLLPAPTVALQNVTASVYRARQGSAAVSVLVQWGLLTAEQLQGELQEYRVEVFEQGQSVVVSACASWAVYSGVRRMSTYVHMVGDNITLMFHFYRTLEVRSILFRCIERNNGIAQQSDS